MRPLNIIKCLQSLIVPFLIEWLHWFCLERGLWHLCWLCCYFFSGKLYPISVLSNFGCQNCPLDLIIANSRAFEIRLEREKFDTCQKITAAFSFDLATRSRLNHFCLSFPFNKLLFFFFLLSFCQQTLLVTTGKTSQQKFLTPLIVIFLLSAFYRMDLFIPSLI